MDTVLPDWMKKAEQDDAPYRTQVGPLNSKDLRLVYSWPNPKTKVLKEVMLETMEFHKTELYEVKNPQTGKIHVVTVEGGKFRVPGWAKRLGLWTNALHPTDFKTGARLKPFSVKWDDERYIPGTSEKIVKAPEEKEDDPRNAEYYDSDTLLIQSDEETFIPSLTAMPMPGTVIDELRNKYSRTRTRHEESYLEARVEKEQVKQRVEMQREKLMKTPGMEFQERVKAARKQVDGQKVLGKDVMMKIGEMMAKNMTTNRVKGRLERVGAAV